MVNNVLLSDRQARSAAYEYELPVTTENGRYSYVKLRTCMSIFSINFQCICIMFANSLVVGTLQSPSIDSQTAGAT